MEEKTYPNLKPWQPGTSGNPAGRKPGIRNVSTIVRELLEQDIDDNFPMSERIAQVINGKSKSYIEALVISMIKKAIDGDVRAATWLIEQQKGSSSQEGLFNASKLVVEVVKSQSALD